MRLISPLPHRKGRLEIIPLIDILFFLLASFMIVSMAKIKVNSLKINLPTDVPSVQRETKQDFVSVSINAQGQVQIEKELITSKDALLPKLQEIYAKNKDQKILISADKDSTHEEMMVLLGKVRAAGFQKVAFTIKAGGSKPMATP